MHLPAEFEERMRKILGSGYDEYITAMNSPEISAGIRINTLKANARRLILKELGNPDSVPWCGDGFYIDKAVLNGKHPYHAAGLFYFQEPSAMSVCEGIPIEEGDYVLDLCAAPGGKATHAAQKLHGTGMLMANEIISRRAEILSENIMRMGIKNAVVTNESPDRLAAKYPRMFDKIILDAPCSGEGMFKKELQAVEEWSKEHVHSCALRQQNIIDSAMKLLKPGGMLVYSTCTFSIEENEQNAEYMIDRYDMEMCAIEGLSMLEPGINGYTAHDMTAARRIFPHTNRGEGHFLALLKSSGIAEEGYIPQYSSDKKADNAMKMYREFEKSFLNVKLSGYPILFGEQLYLMPVPMNIDKIRVIRPGLHLGTLKKNRFEPSHALALSLDSNAFGNTLSIGKPEADLYLKGNTLPCSASGWCAVLYNGCVLGWGKVSGGILKNHYPKKLRML